MHFIEVKKVLSILQQSNHMILLLFNWTNSKWYFKDWEFLILILDLPKKYLKSMTE